MDHSASYCTSGSLQCVSGAKLQLAALRQHFVLFIASHQQPSVEKGAHGGCRGISADALIIVLCPPKGPKLVLDLENFAKIE